MKCVSCGSYFKQSAFNKSLFCEQCLDIANDTYDQELLDEISQVINPSGKTQAVFYDDADVDSFSS
jgi:hypothetical protein